jgi:choice-of-anchor A domain-containing protein
MKFLRKAASPWFLNVFFKSWIFLALGLGIANAYPRHSGLWNNFDIYVLGDMNYSNSDLQGRLGAGGRVSLSHTGLAHQSPRHTFSLIAGDDVTFQNGDVFNGGIESAGNIYIRHAAIFGNVSSGGSIHLSNGDIQGSASAAGGVYVTRASVRGSRQRQRYVPSMDLRAISYEALRHSDLLADLCPTNTVRLVENRTLVIEAHSGLNVVRIDSQQLEESRALKIVGPYSAQVLINVEGHALELNRTRVELAGQIQAEQVLLNLPDTRFVGLRGVAIKSSLLAPFANTSFNSGWIEGRVYVQNLEDHGSILRLPHLYGPRFDQIDPRQPRGCRHQSE